MKTFRNAFQKVQKVFDALVSVCLIVMIAVVFLQTFCRFVIFYSLPWSEELSRYLFVALIVLGANLAITRKMFVRIEIIDNYLKGSAATALLFARKLVAIFVNTVFVYGSYKLMQIGSYQTSPAMGIPMDLFTFVGFFALIQIEQLHECCKILGHFGTDDDLILSASDDDRQYIGLCFNLFFLCQSLVLEFKPQTSCTGHQLVDVFLAAHQRQQFFCFLFQHG